MGIIEATDLYRNKGIYVLIQSSDGTVTNVLRETEQVPYTNDNLSTTAIDNPDKRLIIKRRRHVSPQNNQANQDTPKEVRSILRSPPTRRNRGHRRSASLSTSFLSSSILSPVFDYFNTTSLDSPRKDLSPKKKSVQFSLPNDEDGEAYTADVDTDLEAARCRLSCLFREDVYKKTHRRTQARMCMKEIIFGLDVNDFCFFSNEEGVQIPTLISFKTRNDDSSSGQHFTEQPKSPKHHNNIPHHYRRSRQYSFTV
jgi:hypothetical protein